MVDDFVAPEVVAGAHGPALEVVERHALAEHEARVGRVEEVLVEGPSKKDPACGRAAPVRTSSSTSRPSGGARRRRPRRRRVTYAAPHWLRGDLVDRRPECRADPPASSPHPVVAERV